jgi:outer membrane scaffolding protein for murein synthesis (MipA/OmpV family)
MRAPADVRRRRRPFAAASVVCVALLPAVARAEGLALWEIGLGVAGLYLPDYRGADEARAYALPFPVVIYRGERVRADREGLRGRLFDTDRVELDVSLGGALPVRSDRNEARRGMPALDPVLEFGPSLVVRLARSDDRRRSVELRLPARAAYSVDRRGLHGVGAVFTPQLRAAWRDTAWGWDTDVSVGPMYASRAFHQYVYGVDPAFATPDRPTYRAPGGYAGAQLTLTANRRLGSLRLFGFVRAEALSGAVYASSPLVRRGTQVLAGFGVGAVLAESSRRAPTPE